MVVNISRVVLLEKNHQNELVDDNIDEHASGTKSKKIVDEDLLKSKIESSSIQRPGLFH